MCLNSVLPVFSTMQRVLGAILLLFFCSANVAAQTIIYPIGNSITRGTVNFGDNDGYDGFNFPSSNYRLINGGPPANIRSYREHLHDLLIDGSCGADLDWVGNSANPSGRTPLNHEGWSGWRADQIVTNIDQWMSTLPSTPEVVTLHIGTNDILQGQTAASTKNEIDTLLTKIYNANSGVTVLLANVIPLFSPRSASEIAQAAQLSSMIPALVTSHANAGHSIFLVDVRSGFTGLDMRPDGIHPNVFGDKLIADRFFAAFQQHYSSVCAGGTSDTTPPIAAISNPASDGDTTSSNPVLTGNATDSGGSGFNRVRIAIEKTSTNQWFNFSNNSFGSGFAFTLATLSNTSTDATDWQISANLGSGSFRLYALAVDNNENWPIKANGSKIWTERTFSTSGTPPPPGQASLVSPSGNISNNTPTYTWNAVTGSTWYYLWVNDASGTTIKKWYTASQVGCAGGSGTCSIKPATPVTGNSKWWIRTWNNSGSGPWSAAKSFDAGGVNPPSAATLVSPDGANATSNPTYTWNAAAGSTWYYLWVNDSSGTVIKKWFSASQTGCSGGSGICSIQPTTVISGSATWWIQTWNTSGRGPWSAGKTFQP